MLGPFAPFGIICYISTAAPLQCEMEAGRNGLVEGMTGGNDC